MIKQQWIAIIGLFLLMMGLSACQKNYLKEDEVDNTFEQDYALISEVTEYLLSLEEDSVHINFASGKITCQMGESMEIQSEEIGKTLNQLMKNGYCHITKKDSIVLFDVWRKPFYAEFEAGFVYSIDGTGDVSAIQFLIGQRPLEEKNWYYYEADYNEWRSNQSDASVSSAGK